MELNENEFEDFTRIKVICLTHGEKVYSAEETRFLAGASSYQDQTCVFWISEVSK